MKVITLSNQKGGVAKTTTSSALSAGLYNRGFRVLAVDLDPQCNFCFGCGVDMLQIEKSLYDVFKGAATVQEIAVPVAVGYDLIPGGLTLAGADMDFTQTGREYMLTEALQTVKDKYDYVVIDTPPTLGILTVNALTASDVVVVPMTADVYSVQGLSQLESLIRNVRKYCNNNLQIAGLLLTKYNERQNASRAAKDMIEDAAAQIGTKVFNTCIRESVAVREAALLQNDIFKEAPKANATIDYNGFIDELLGGLDNGK